MTISATIGSQALKKIKNAALSELISHLEEDSGFMTESELCSAVDVLATSVLSLPQEDLLLIMAGNRWMLDSTPSNSPTAYETIEAIAHELLYEELVEFLLDEAAKWLDNQGVGQVSAT